MSVGVVSSSASNSGTAGTQSRTGTGSRGGTGVPGGAGGGFVEAASAARLGGR